MSTIKITLELNTEEFVILTKFKNNELKQLVKDIFTTGYNIHFPPYDIKEEQSNFNIINKLENLELNLNKLIGISSNSSKKGLIAENILEHIFNDRYGDIKYEKKNHIPHSGDAWLYLPDDKIIMIESKNYTTTVNKDEILKLQSDMITHNIKWSILVSFNSMIQGMKELDIHTFLHNNETYSIIMISNLALDFHKLDLGLQIIRKLILKFNNISTFPWIIDDITQNLNELNLIIKKNYILRDTFYNMEKQINTSLSLYHNILRDYQYELDQKINDIICKIQNTTNKSIQIKQTEINYQNILDKYQNKKILALITRIIDLSQSKQWIINHSENDTWFIINKNNVYAHLKIFIKKISITIISNDITFVFNIDNEKQNKQNFDIIKLLQIDI